MAKKNIFSFRNILIVILLTPVVFYVIWLETVTYQLKSIKEELQAEGTPVTYEDLAEIASQDDDRANAINFIIEAGSLEEWPQEPNPPIPMGGMMGMSGGMSMGTPTSSVEEENPPVYGYMPKDMFNLSEEEKGNLKKYLEANKRQIEALQNAIEIGWYRENMHWEDGFDGRWEGLSELKQSTKLVQYQAISFVNDGEIDKAIELLNTWYGMVQESNHNKPYTFIQALVSISCRYMLDDTARWMIREKDMGNEKLIRLYEQIEPIDYEELMPSILQTEAVFAFTGLADYEAFSRYDSLNEIEAKFYAYSGLAKLSAIRYNELIEKYTTASRYDFYRMQKEYKKIDLEVEQLESLVYKPIKDFFPAIERVLYLIGKSVSCQEMLKIMLANEMFKNDNGGYAESLEVLKKHKTDLEIEDPFRSTGLYGYQTTIEDGKVTGYFIWSITDKSNSEITDAIDKMIADGLNTVNELPDEYDNDIVIYRVR